MMAMDYLPIQATSVPCERVFSSAKDTDTAKRNRINPILMEALHLLKFSLKKERLDFSAKWATSEADMSCPTRVHKLHTLLNGDGESALDTVLNDLNIYDLEAE